MAVCAFPVVPDISLAQFSLVSRNYSTLVLNFFTSNFVADTDVFLMIVEHKGFMNLFQPFYFNFDQNTLYGGVLISIITTAVRILQLCPTFDAVLNSPTTAKSLLRFY